MIFIFINIRLYKYISIDLWLYTKWPAMGGQVPGGRRETWIFYL